MFGYVKPYTPELKVKHLESYQAAYCGLCKELGQRYGILSRFLLNYDLLFLALLQDALADEPVQYCKERCIAHPFSKRHICCKTAGLSYAADALILLSYYKLLDTIADERFFKRFSAHIALLLVKSAYKKAAALHPALNQALRDASDKQFSLEASQVSSLDAAAEPTGAMLSAAFSACCFKPENKLTLQRLGMFSGQVIYLLDAAADYDEDKKKGRYNPLLLQYNSKEDALKFVKIRIQMARGEMALCYNTLSVPLYKDLLDNIIFLGLGIAAEHAGQK